MKRYLTIIVTVLTASLAHSEQFELTDEESAHTYGPFEYTNGVTVSLDGRLLTLKRVQTKADVLTEKMKKIMIPSIEFRNANVTDVVNFLVDASAAGDPDGVGTSILLSRVIPLKDEQSTNDHFSAPFFSPEDENAPAPQPESRGITLNLRRISLYDALHIITEAAGLTFKVHDRGVVILNEKKEVVGGTRP
jgi:hypothetical protein